MVYLEARRDRPNEGFVCEPVGADWIVLVSDERVTILADPSCPYPTARVVHLDLPDDLVSRWYRVCTIGHIDLQGSVRPPAGYTVRGSST